MRIPNTNTAAGFGRPAQEFGIFIRSLQFVFLDLEAVFPGVRRHRCTSFPAWRCGLRAVAGSPAEPRARRCRGSADPSRPSCGSGAGNGPPCGSAEQPRAAGSVLQRSYVIDGFCDRVFHGRIGYSEEFIKVDSQAVQFLQFFHLDDAQVIQDALQK